VFFRSRKETAHEVRALRQQVAVPEHLRAALDGVGVWSDSACFPHFQNLAQRSTLTAGGPTTLAISDYDPVGRREHGIDKLTGELLLRLQLLAVIHERPVTIFCHLFILQKSS
jgi:hypothetical protein